MRKPLILHPFLFTALPVLRLFKANMDLCTPRIIVVPLIVLTCVMLTLWLVLTLLMKGKERAALFLSVFMTLSLSYIGFTALAGWATRSLNGPAVALLLWITFLFLMAYMLMRIRSPAKLTRLFNVTALFLVAISVAPIAAHSLRQKGISPMQSSEHGQALGDGSGMRADLPNIYYIILDGYARGDVLAELYDYDNTEFLDHLRQRGFYVASRSRSNYPQTVLSLASSLNSEYLGDLAQEIGTDCHSRLPMTNMIRYNKAIRLLKQRGYTFITFSVGVPCAEITNADRHIGTGHLGEFSN